MEMKTRTRYAGVYLHGDTLILHALGQMPRGGGLISREPVVRLPKPVSAAEVGRTVRQMLDSFRFDVEWSKGTRDEFLKATGFRSWRQLEGPARSCWIREEAAGTVLTPLRNGGSRGDEKGFQPFGAEEIRCATGCGDEEIGAALLRALDLSR